jgi:hypothetical protein
MKLAKTVEKAKLMGNQLFPRDESGLIPLAISHLLKSLLLPFAFYVRLRLSAVE